MGDSLLINFRLSREFGDVLQTSPFIQQFPCRFFLQFDECYWSRMSLRQRPVKSFRPHSHHASQFVPDLKKKIGPKYPPPSMYTSDAGTYCSVPWGMKPFLFRSGRPFFVSRSKTRVLRLRGTPGIPPRGRPGGGALPEDTCKASCEISMFCLGGDIAGQ